MAILDVADMAVDIRTEDGTIHAVRDVSFDVRDGEFFGVVGESGSGKSVLVQSVLGLIPTATVSGRAMFRGVDLLSLDKEQLRRKRGREISMIFQDPLSSLHPQYTIGWQIAEQIRAHERVSKAAARARTIELLSKVRIPDAAARFDAYPHQFSGGMRQRVMIAIAISCEPSLLVADEPTTALDVTVQAQILELLARLQRESGMAIVFITHDLGVVARVADRMMVMYAGRVVEDGPAEVIFADPQMPYTRGLLRSVPRFDQLADTSLVPIRGNPPDVMRQANHCSFAPRCDSAFDTCLTVVPPLAPCGPDHRSACLLAGRLPPIGADAS